MPGDVYGKPPSADFKANSLFYNAGTLTQVKDGKESGS